MSAATLRHIYEHVLKGRFIFFSSPDYTGKGFSLSGESKEEESHEYHEAV